MELCVLYRLHEWAPGCPRAFQSAEERQALYPGFRAAALDNLIAACRIRDRDREQVMFLVRVLVRPNHPSCIAKGQP